MAEQRNFLQTGEFSCIHCDFKCDSNDQQKIVAHIHTHSENLVSEAMQATKEHDKRVGAEVLATCLAKIRERYNRLPSFNDASPEFFDLIKEIEQLQPAAEALVKLLREARLEARIDERERAIGFGAPARDLRLAELKVELEKARAVGKG